MIGRHWRRKGQIHDVQRRSEDAERTPLPAVTCKHFLELAQGSLLLAVPDDDCRVARFARRLGFGAVGRTRR